MPDVQFQRYLSASRERIPMVRRGGRGNLRCRGRIEDPRASKQSAGSHAAPIDLGG